MIDFDINSEKEEYEVELFNVAIVRIDGSLRQLNRCISYEYLTNDTHACFHMEDGTQYVGLMEDISELIFSPVYSTSDEVSA